MSTIEKEDITINSDDDCGGYEFIDCNVTFSFKVTSDEHDLLDIKEGESSEKYFTKEFIDVFKSSPATFTSCRLSMPLDKTRADRRSDKIKAKLHEYTGVSINPENNTTVNTITLWCGKWVDGMALYSNGQYWSYDKVTMFDTPSMWKVLDSDQKAEMDKLNEVGL